MTAPAGYTQLPSGFWVRDDGSGPYFIDVTTGAVSQIGDGGGGGGTVTNDEGTLTEDNIILGNGGNDVKRVGGLSTDGTSGLLLGEAGSSVGKVTMRNATSGSVTIEPVTGALGSSTLLAPAASGTIATTQNITDAVTGLSWKAPCRVATTVAGTLATSFENGDTVDGVVLATGDRILLKNQAAGAENGLYTVNASGAPTRTTDADSGTEILNASVLITAGTTNANRQYTCNTVGPITINVTSLTFVQINASGGSVATDPIWQAAGDIVYATGAAAAVRLAKGTALQGLRINAGATAPEWATIEPTITASTVAAILAAAAGGTLVPETFLKDENGDLWWNSTASRTARITGSGGSYLGAGTWASRPASGLTTGDTYRATDIGLTPGTMFVWNGTRFKSLAGRYILASGAAVTAAHTSEPATPDVVISVPAGLLTTGNRLWGNLTVHKGQTTTDELLRVYFGPLGTSSDPKINHASGQQIMAAGGNRSVNVEVALRVDSATTMRQLGSGSSAGNAFKLFSGASTDPMAAVTISNVSSVACFLSFSVYNTTAADSVIDDYEFEVRD